MRIGIFGSHASKALAAVTALVASSGHTAVPQADHVFSPRDVLGQFDAIVVNIDSPYHELVADTYDDAGVTVFYVEGDNETVPSELVKHLGATDDAVDAQLGRDLVAILEVHQALADNGPADVLRRIIKERDKATGALEAQSKAAKPVDTPVAAK